MPKTSTCAEDEDRETSDLDQRSSPKYPERADTPHGGNERRDDVRLYWIEFEGVSVGRNGEAWVLAANRAHALRLLRKKDEELSAPEVAGKYPLKTNDGERELTNDDFVEVALDEARVVHFDDGDY